MCVGAQRPDVLEAGACVRRCPEARLSLEAGLTYIGASKPPRHAARLVRIDGMPPSGARPHFGIYIYIYLNISRAETVELRTWISQRSQRQLRPNGVSPDKYLETWVSGQKNVHCDAYS